MYKISSAIVILFSIASLAGCQSPEERATGEEGAGKRDSTLNSPPKEERTLMDSTTFDSNSTTEIEDTAAVKDRKEP